MDDPHAPQLPADAVEALTVSGLDPNDRRWLFIVPLGEIALRLGISTASVYAALNRRELPTVRLGRRMTVPRASFEAWLAQQSQVSAVGSAGAGDRAR
jgi:excisionase family DNA binding protein